MDFVMNVLQLKIRKCIGIRLEEERKEKCLQGI
jgi:hypothetical protein